MELLPFQIHTIEKFFIMGESQKILFRGKLNNEKPNGFGILFQFGDVYIGKMKNGYKHGYGIWKCRKGYKIIGRTGSFKTERGVYIGYFRYDRFIHGVFIEFNKEYIKKNFIKNRLYNGISILKHKDYTILSTYKDNILNGKYIYKHFENNYIFETNIVNNNFNGPSIRKNNEFYEYLFYKDGKILGKSIYHIYKTDTTYILKWKNKEYNYCKEIFKISNKDNRLYYPIKNLNTYKIPEDFLCPISYEIMIQPVETSMGQVYDYKSILKWKYKYNKKTDPLTNCRIDDSFLICPTIQYNIFKYIEDELFREKKELFLVK